MPDETKVPAAVSAAIICQDWRTVESYLSEQILYRPGSGAEITGRANVIKRLREIFENIAHFTRHQVRQVWQGEGRVAIEMDAYYRRLSDGQEVVIACTDIYRVQDEQLNEWRVYADVTPLFTNGKPQ
jgi:limonene-1,2-epoxide hydrolase